MELLFVVLGAVLIGALLRYLLPGRHSYGAALLPAVGGIVSAAIWASVTWLGWRFDGGWIWVISLVVGGIACLILGLLLPRRRRTEDERLFATLSRS